MWSDDTLKAFLAAQNKLVVEPSDELACRSVAYVFDKM